MFTHSRIETYVNHLGAHVLIVLELKIHEIDRNTAISCQNLTETQARSSGKNFRFKNEKKRIKIKVTNKPRRIS